MDDTLIAITPGRKEALEAAERCVTILQQQFGVGRIVVFGSAAGDAPWHSHSDLDLAVEGLQPQDYAAAVNACYELLPPGLALDLIPLEDAPLELLARIEGEMTMPDDPHAALLFEIETELRRLEQLAEKLTHFLETAAAEPDEIQVQGGAKYLHDFYNGVERLFERIAVRVDGDLPVAGSWHTLLLQRMGRPFGGRRSAVIDQGLEVRLSEYLRFRHLFRHTYGYDLEWPRVRLLSQALPDTLNKLKQQLAAFLSQLAADNN